MQTELQSLSGELAALHSEMVNLAHTKHSLLARIHPENRSSTINLLHYLVLRRHDIRVLQERLAALGLSSLGRTEPHVLSGVRAVMTILSGLHHGDSVPLLDDTLGCDRDQGHRLLERNTDSLLGSAPEGRKVRIMVTMPPEAATDYALIRNLLLSGMNCMRINCAHDGEEAWSGMIRNLREAEHETGKSCKIEMDVAGPKLRTGPMEPGPAVIKYRPKRDAFGRVEKAARIWLTPRAHAETSPTPVDACIPVPGRWLAPLQPGDGIRFTDSRGSRRSMTVTETVEASRWAESFQTAYITNGIVLAAHKDKLLHTLCGRVGNIPPRSQTIVLRPSDTLILTRALDPGRGARFNRAGELLSPARIGVTQPEFFESVRPGQPIWFDDGKIGGIISKVDRDEVLVEIKHAKVAGDKLGAEKGINVPDTNLAIASLTPDDLKALEFIVKNADILGYSFVRTEDDVRLLQSHLARLGARDLGIVLKVETREGFENLPSLLMAAMESRSVGVMIARGDLAIECGYQRLAEAQEEILWISEAAHIPVVWATQVLETLAKTGTPSRSEITDAAMGERAECVMLNKGPYIVEAVQTLDDILQRMQAHQDKKRSMLRKLNVAAEFEDSAAANTKLQVPTLTH